MNGHSKMGAVKLGANASKIGVGSKGDLALKMSARLALPPVGDNVQSPALFSGQRNTVRSGQRRVCQQ